MDTSTTSQSGEVNKVKQDPLDPEWIELIMVARDMGLTIEEIRNFLLKS